MNILHLRASNFYGGPERQLHQHARLAAGSGVNVIVASFAEHGKYPNFLSPIAADGIETHCFAVKNAYDITAVRKLKNYLARHDISVLCTHDYRSDIIGWRASRNPAIPWVAFSRGVTRENLKVRLYHWVDQHIIRRAAQVVAVSNEQRNWLQRNGVAAENIVVVHNAIDPGLFAKIPTVDLRKQFRWDNDTVIGVAAGRFSTEKGQSLLVDAAALILSDHSQLRLILYGDGPDHSYIQKKINDLGINDKVILPGYLKGVIGPIKGADFLVNPSLSEGLPNVVLEAMAVEIPVLATAVGGVPEIIEHQKTGLLVESASAKALAEGILFLLNNREKRIILAKSGLEFVTNRCSFTRQNELLCQLYQKLIGE